MSAGKKELILELQNFYVVLKRVAWIIHRRNNLWWRLIKNDTQYPKKVLHKSFHANGYNLEFHPQTQTLQPLCTALWLGIPIDRVPTSKSCVFCLGIKFLFFPFDRFLVPSCCKDYFLEKFSDSVWWLYKPAM